MARDEKRRQKSLQRRTAKRKQHNQALAGGQATVRGVMRQAADWPLYECLMSRDWDVEGEIVQILVAREGPSGEIAAGSVLVDLGCLGVKNAAEFFLPPGEYHSFIREAITSLQPMVEVDLDLAAKVIRAGIAYAQSLGFSPHRDYARVAPLFSGADPDSIADEVPVGSVDGQPLYVVGPDDNVGKITRQLERAVGSGNFHVIGPEELLTDEDDLEQVGPPVQMVISTSGSTINPAERQNRNLGKLLQQQEFETPEEANAFLEKLMTETGGRIPRVESETPLERAQDLMYDA